MSARTRNTGRRLAQVLSLLVLFSFSGAAGTGARAGLLSLGWGQRVSMGGGIVHVWSEFPPSAVGGAALVYPAWGYRFHPDYAMVDCDVEPEEAVVSLDGETVGEADDFDGFPSYLFIRPGQHVLEFRAPGYQTLVIRGSFRSGAFIRVDRELERGGEPRVVQLDEPLDVTGMEETGYAPPVLPPDDGPAGPAAPPASPRNGSVPPAVAGEAGFLKLEVSPADAAVYIDDRFFGSGDEISRLHGFIRLAPGPHSIQVTRPGYEDRTLPVSIIAGEKQHLDIPLEPLHPDQE